MTSCRKFIWTFIFIEMDGTRTQQKIAGINFLEAISALNKEAQNLIIEVKRSDEEVTFHY